MSDLESPEPDVAEQHQPAESAPAADPAERPIDAPEADALEQVQPVPIDWDEQQEGG